MSERTEFEKLPSETNCGVNEKLFPVMRKCCFYSDALQRHQSICPFCKVYTLPPAGETLEVAIIFECGQYGYCKRVKE